MPVRDWPGVVAAVNTERCVLPVPVEGRVVTYDTSTFPARLVAPSGAHLGLSPPALFAVSPQTGELVIGEGEGSGQSSRLRLFRLSDDAFMEDSRLPEMLQAEYFSQVPCARRDNLGLWPAGFEAGTGHLVVLAQPTRAVRCTNPQDFIVYFVDLHDRRLVRSVRSVDEPTVARLMPFLSLE